MNKKNVIWIIVFVIFLVVASCVGVVVYVKQPIDFVGYLLGGFLASFVIGWFWSWYFFNKGVKQELEKEVNELKDFLEKLHKRQIENSLNMYKNRLVHQLESDIALIWNVRPGATVGCSEEDCDVHAMDNADEKYYEVYNKIQEESEKILKSLLEKITD